MSILGVFWDEYSGSILDWNFIEQENDYKILQELLWCIFLHRFRLLVGLTRTRKSISMRSL